MKNLNYRTKQMIERNAMENFSWFLLYKACINEHEQIISKIKFGTDHVLLTIIEFHKIVIEDYYVKITYVHV